MQSSVAISSNRYISLKLRRGSRGYCKDQTRLEPYDQMRWCIETGEQTREAFFKLKNKPSHPLPYLIFIFV